MKGKIYYEQLEFPKLEIKIIVGNLLKLKWQVLALYSLSISMVLKVLKLCSFSCVEAMPRLEKDVKLIYRLCIYSIIHPIKLLKNA